MSHYIKTTFRTHNVSQMYNNFSISQCSNVTFGYKAKKNFCFTSKTKIAVSMLFFTNCYALGMSAFRNTHILSWHCSKMSRGIAHCFISIINPGEDKKTQISLYQLFEQSCKNIRSRECLIRLPLWPCSKYMFFTGSHHPTLRFLWTLKV